LTDRTYSTDRRGLEAAVASVGHRWWHSIDLGHGIVTPGTKPPETMRAEIDALGLPADLSGKTVLDIGAWDGAFSFECERRGAGRVVALDHFIWSVDLDAQQDYLRACAERGEAPRPWDEVPEVWKPDELPGRAGFDVALAALDSKVEPVVADFSTMDLEPLGRFDIVLYLGVLYHMPDPYGSLQRVATVTAGEAFVETELLVVPGGEEYGACEFLATDELGRDPTNWWVPNRTALMGMLRAAGFARVHMPPAPVALQPPWPPVHRRLARAAVRQKTGRADPYPPVAPVRYRSVARASK
jgi:tRNA (mo5U34)-methyltransferase